MVLVALIGVHERLHISDTSGVGKISENVAMGCALVISGGARTRAGNRALEQSPV